ncbi:methyltransferase domain-containing protein [Phormidesmis priestleyi ULC007]|uniref:Methyltransferase domain-containing protein n=1 Tax=Phormidesmis priestleyi ULC007 TaxID=1920490 RepID=A0A2T1DJF9_9CYAN|nr:methyltransferase domain-containing protein [Phormidesmis priestleyi]PSB20612.1 methyltransferase domain-containing protein [Phormidesmis priestleyi ULC007]PZO54282.1 MAG: methyltransferase domain-containing protein [Phormidesmis priestleyi]
MNDSERTKNWYGQVAANYSSDQRKNWYGDVAEAYNKVRPRYPQTLIDRAIAVAQLPPGATILELGCGPGIATVPFARSGFSMVCLEPSQVYQPLTKVYQSQAPSLVAEREDRATQERILQGLTQDIADSGLFRTAVCEHLPCKMTYSIDDYLMLLNTFSPYKMLDPSERDSVFTSLREVLERLGEGVQVCYLSAFHIAEKI